MKTNKINILINTAAGICTMLLLIACGSNVTEPENAQRIIINNNKTVLGNRITYLDEKIQLHNINEADASLAKMTSDNIWLELLAEVDAPVLDGHTLHASHVTFSNGHAFVSYSTKDNEFRGGVEIYDLIDANSPTLKSQALFTDTDISIAVESLGKLYLGEATDSDHNEAFDSPACLEVIEMQDFRITPTSQRIDLPSYNANDIQLFDDAIFVSTGTTGGAHRHRPFQQGDQGCAIQLVSSPDPRSDGPESWGRLSFRTSDGTGSCYPQSSPRGAHCRIA